MVLYLDAAATTPVDPRVAETVMHYMVEEYGNAGSRTHEFGQRAKYAVERARAQVAAVVGADPSEIIFTSGATESNNIALLGLAPYGEQTGRKHLVSTAIEHKAVLEPLAELERRGFEVTLICPDVSGAVDPDEVRAAVRPDTLAVSIMQVNNETGIIQPIVEIAELLPPEVYFHVDAAQGFGKELEALRHHRIDLVSISGHKVFAPKGIGALLTRRRGWKRPPLQPLVFGGGQERGLRAGTLAVPMVAGLGVAAELAASEWQVRRAIAFEMGDFILRAIEAAGGQINGQNNLRTARIVSASFAGLDGEAVMLGLKDHVAISNGSACTTDQYGPSHVLLKMGLTESVARMSVRFSWSELMPWDLAATDSILQGLNQLCARVRPTYSI